MDLQQLIGWTFQLSIVAAAFGCGLKATTADVRDPMQQPGPLGRSLLAMFVIVPVVAVALVHAFDFPQGAEVALIALAISPLAALIPGNLIKAGRRPSCAVAPMATVANAGRIPTWSAIPPNIGPTTNPNTATPNTVPSA